MTRATVPRSPSGRRPCTRTSGVRSTYPRARSQWLRWQVGEEMMVAIPLALLIQRNHKQVGASELTQELGGTLPTHNRVAKRTCHPPQHRGSEQKLLRILRQTRKNLLSQ